MKQNADPGNDNVTFMWASRLKRDSTEMCWSVCIFSKTNLSFSV